MKYRIEGGSFPVAIINLECGEKILTNVGRMSWMDNSIKMNTTSNGGVKKMLGRFFTQESLFLNEFEAAGTQGMIAVSASNPGTIKPLKIGEGAYYIIQKQSFLASDLSVNIDAYLLPDFKVGMFGAEGFVLQKATGYGDLLLEIDGSLQEYQLSAGESMIISSGALVGFSTSCSISVRAVEGAKNIFLGGEGLFLTVVTGPGLVIVQTMKSKI